MSLPQHPSAVVSMPFQEADSGTMCTWFCHLATYTECHTRHHDEDTLWCSPDSLTVPVYRQSLISSPRPCFCHLKAASGWTPAVRSVLRAALTPHGAFESHPCCSHPHSPFLSASGSVLRSVRTPGSITCSLLDISVIFSLGLSQPASLQVFVWV